MVTRGLPLVSYLDISFNLPLPISSNAVGICSKDMPQPIQNQPGSHVVLPNAHCLDAFRRVLLARPNDVAPLMSGRARLLPPQIPLLL